jgi:hypothetical protein
VTEVEKQWIYTLGDKTGGKETRIYLTFNFSYIVVAPLALSVINTLVLSRSCSFK